MANTKSYRIGALLSLLIVAASIKFFYEPGYERTDEPYDRIEGSYTPQVLVRRPYVPEEPDTSQTHGVSRDTWVAPTSIWLNKEKKAAATALAWKRYTLTIIPVQGDENAFDPTERSIMSRLVNDHISRDAGTTVPSHDNVLRYLGVHKASYPETNIKALSDLTHSQRILILHAQHNRQGLWELTASLVDHELVPLKEDKVWNNLHYSDEQPPSVTLELILDEVVEYAIEKSVDNKKRRLKFDAEDFKFPDSVVDLAISSETSPLHAAANLQMLAALHPKQPFNETRNFLFERSLAKLHEVEPSSDYYRYFKARAYVNLGRRPAALHSLGTPRNSHELALLAYINGNLSDLHQHASKTKTSALDFMTWLDLHKMEWIYEKKGDHDFIERISSAHPIWAPFLTRSVQNFETWSNYSMADIKFGLEDLVPIPDVSMRDRVARQLVTGDLIDELELTKLTWRHIEAAESASLPDALSVEPVAYNRALRDILGLARSIGVASHMGKVADDIYKRGLPEAALARISEFEPLFAGNPELTLLKGLAQYKLGQDSSGSDKEYLSIMSAETLLNGFAWTRTISLNAAWVARSYQAFLEYSSYGGTLPKRENYVSGYSRRYFEWPRGQNWYTSYGAENNANGMLDRCLAYQLFTFECLKFEIERQQKTSDSPDEIRDALLASYSHRWAGHPEKSEYEAIVARGGDSIESISNSLREQIDAGSVDWATFKILGRLHKRQGEYSEAADVMMSYPGFQPDANVSKLTISQYADVAAADLFWIGQYELAMPFLEIAANSRTGSGSQMSSAQRIALINRDWQAAQHWSAERVRRYNSKHGLRDLLQILHILDQSELAWSIFDQAKETAQNSQMWSGALIGHRMQSASITDIAEWINSSKPGINAFAVLARSRSPDFAPRYLLMAGTMDRAPGPDLANIVDKAHTQQQPRYIHMPLYESEEGVPEPPRARVSSNQGYITHDDLIPSPRDERRKESNVGLERRYTMIASAMIAFNSGEYAEAYERFNETAYFYPLDEYLPYHVFSAAVLDKSEHLLAALNAREPALEALRKNETAGGEGKGYRFDEDLAYAVLSAFNNDHELAVEYLSAALNNRPFIDDRSIYPMYEVVDLADRLFERTGDDSYRSFALEVSRRHTVVLPMYAWAYFVVAKHSASFDERVAALASGLKLDPLSHRGQSLPDELINKAQELLKKKGTPYLTTSELPQIEEAAQSEST